MNRPFANLIRITGVMSLLFFVFVGFGVMSVRPGEVVVVRRFGRFLPRVWRPGLHLGLPLGLDRADRVRIDEVRKLSVGSEGVPDADMSAGSGEYLTGDQNLIRVRGVLQYRVADPVRFVAASQIVEKSLSRLGESALVHALAHRGIDPILRDERTAIAREVERELVTRTDRYGLGISILGFNMTDARPPLEVQAEFDAAQSARSLRDERVEQARTESLGRLTAARAEGTTRIDLAQAKADRRTQLAKSEAARFRSLLAEIRRARPLSIRRIYYDSLVSLLPRIKRKLILTPNEPIDLGVIEGDKK